VKNLVFLLAPDSFKGSLTAKEVCLAMERGIKAVLPTAECIKAPMADGGEGTVQSLVDATGGQLFELQVTGPLGNPVRANYGIMGDGTTAAIEMASASGLHLVNEHNKNPFLTTTYGTGELVKACLDKGVKKIIIGIGGSATNDGGAGFARALGVRLLDNQGCELSPGGAALSRLYKIDVSKIDIRLKKTDIEVACDVDNPLCGENGATNIFGAQKGATPEMIKTLDAALHHYAVVLKEQLGKDVMNVPGAGAAGGLGAGLLAFTDAKMKRGTDLIIDYINLRDAIKKADYVFTGEGGIDIQTQYGKTPYGVAQAAKAEGKKVIAIAGYIGDDIDMLYNTFDAIIGILPGVMSLPEAIQSANRNITRTVENIVRILMMETIS
jgi:glycerate kinase